MYLTYEKYKSLGYDYVSEKEFLRYYYEAHAVIDFFTSGRIPDPDEFPSADDLFPSVDDFKTLRGICEIIDIIKRRRNEDKGNLAGFSNEGYSESYKSGGTAELYAEVYAAMTIWFDQNLISRGI